MDQGEALVGATGVLVVATRGPAGAGEAMIRFRGGTESYLAWSDEPLPRGTTVLVVAVRGARQVTVIPVG